MAESASPYSQTETTPLTGPSSLGSTFDAQGLPTLHEVPQHKATYIDHGSLDNRLHSGRDASAGSRDASIESSVGPSYSEKQIEDNTHRLRHTGPPRANQDEWRRSDSPSVVLNNGNQRYTTVDGTSKPTAMKKEKKSGIRNTLRRMFSRKAARNTIAVPNTAVYPQYVSTIMPPLACPLH